MVVPLVIWIKSRAKVESLKDSDDSLPHNLIWSWRDKNSAVSLGSGTFQSLWDTPSQNQQKAMFCHFCSKRKSHLKLGNLFLGHFVKELAVVIALVEVLVVLSA
jgi:hypothetical protein